MMELWISIPEWLVVLGAAVLVLALPAQIVRTVVAVLEFRLKRQKQRLVEKLNRMHEGKRDA